MSSTNTKKAFDALIEVFKKTTSQSMQAARDLSHMAIKHFQEHGDLSYAEMFLAAMNKDYNRVGAFLKWLQDHSPVIVNGSIVAGYTLKKDKGADDTAFKVAAALLTPFWEYAPPKEEINFGATDVIKALKATVNKFNGDRYHAASDMATLAVSKAMVAIRHLEEEIKADIARPEESKPSVQEAPQEEAA